MRVKRKLCQFRSSEKDRFRRVRGSLGENTCQVKMQMEKGLTPVEEREERGLDRKIIDCSAVLSKFIQNQWQVHQSQSAVRGAGASQAWAQEVQMPGQHGDGFQSTQLDPGLSDSVQSELREMHFHEHHRSQFRMKRVGLMSRLQAWASRA